MLEVIDINPNEIDRVLDDAESAVLLFDPRARIFDSEPESLRINGSIPLPRGEELQYFTATLAGGANMAIAVYISNDYRVAAQRDIPAGENRSEALYTVTVAVPTESGADNYEPTDDAEVASLGYAAFLSAVLTYVD
jgi:hypothetical protein